MRVSLQDGLRRGIRLLQVDAPISQFFERNRHTRDGAADERAGPHDAEIAVQEFDFGLSGPR